MLAMMRQARSIEVEEDSLDRALRPQTFDNYIGQKELIEKLRISIEAAKQRDEPLDHTLMFGPPGLGKTTIANIIATEAETDCKTVVATSIKSTGDLIELLTKTKRRGILFIDEIHAMNKKIEETLYSAMEDYKINVKLGNKEIVKLNVQPFCLIGATTVPGKMAAPLRDRFGIVYTMQLYTPKELAIILMANAKKLNLQIEDETAIDNVAQRSRGTPRIANRLLRRVRDYAQVKNGNRVNNAIVDDAMKLEGVDPLGLTKADYKYLDAILNIYNSGPVGLQAIAATINEDRTTVEDFIEPFLVRLEFIARTQQGRMLTPKGMDYVLDNIADHVDLS